MLRLIFIALCVGLAAATTGCQPPYTGHDENLRVFPVLPYYIPEHKPGAKIYLTCVNSFTLYDTVNNEYVTDNKFYALCSAGGIYIPPIPDKRFECRKSEKQCLLTLSPYLKVNPDKLAFSPRERLTFSCDKGYYLQGNRRNVCLKGGKFLYAIPTCLPYCIEPSQSYLVVSDDDESYMVGGFIDLGCVAGYRLRDGVKKTRYCQDDGSWDPNIEKDLCIKLGCKSPPKITNGYFTPEDEDDEPDKNGWYKIGAKVIYKCKINYLLEGKDWMLCARSGDFIYKAPTCKKIQCDDEGLMINNGDYEEKKKYYDVGKTITYTCNLNYKLSTKSGVRECKLNGDKKSADFEKKPTCEPIRCNDPADIKHGDFGPKQDLWDVNDYVIYTCDPGYYLVGSSKSTCVLDKGYMTATFTRAPVCRPIKCDDPMDLPNGEIVEGEKDEYEVGDEVKYECNDNYYLSGDNTAECKQTGEKTGEFTKAPTCIEILCKDPMEIDNGVFNPSPDEVDNYSIGDEVTYTCNENYKLIGADIAICMKTGPMSAKFTDAPKCVSCKFPGEPANGKTTPKKNRYPAGETVFFSCEPCYKLSGASKATCQDNGQFDNDVPECKMRTCRKSKIPYPPNGFIEPIKKQYDCGEEVEILCRDYFYLKGDKKTTCQPDGEFSIDEKAQCIAITCNLPKLNPQVKVTPEADEYFAPDEITYYCKAGYSPRDPDPETLKAVCEDSGKFSRESIYCDRNKCPRPPMPDNGGIKNDDGAESYLPGSEVEYKCDKGYTLVLDESHGANRCLNNGEWEYDAPFCKPPPTSCKDRCGRRGPGCSCERACSNPVLYLQCCNDYSKECPGAWYLVPGFTGR